MKMIDKAIMASLTRNAAVNLVIGNMPLFADNESFVADLATCLAKGKDAKWCGTDTATELLKSAQRENAVDIQTAMEKALLYSMLNPGCAFEHSELFFLAIERMAAEPDSDRAAIWLTVAASMLPAILINNNTCGDMPF